MSTRSHGFRWRASSVVAVVALVAVLTAVVGCGTGALSSTSTVMSAPATAGPPVSGGVSPVGVTGGAPTTVTSPAAPVATVAASPGFGTTGMAVAGTVSPDRTS